MTNEAVEMIQPWTSENTGIRRTTLFPTSRGKIIGQSPAMREALSTIQRVAASSCTVLVTGPSGTGKELFVAALHDASPRAHRPLVVVNCGAIPENLVEAELFGHARGAFTGAHAARQGSVAAAEGGTLFLDEVGELPLAMQVKLLRLIQQREYTPVGDNRTVKCDVRIVAATNRNLEDEVREGRFREDLFYRLDVVRIQLPALQDRAEDLPALAKHFLLLAATRSMRGDIEGFSPEALDAIQSYAWPGNVRELENAVERAVLLARGPLVEVHDLPHRVTRGVSAPPSEPSTGDRATPLPESGIRLRAAVEEFENGLIRQALDRTGWNRNHAAQLLGLNRTTLVEMIKRKRLAP
jgi:sigma-54 specific flagellar transcriptional regulator A